MAKNAALVYGLALLCAAGCASVKPARDRGPDAPGPPPAPPFPAVKFFILSDLHYHDPALGASGPAFQRYLNEDRKMLAESSEILSAAFDSIVRDTADFVLVCGDLTKDGELFNHLKVSQLLRRVEGSGKKVYVVPGNHDILNYEAYRYDDRGAEPVNHIEPADFSVIYDDFGYGEAVSRDENSLSYVCEPVSGLWLLCLDGNLYLRNRPGHETQVGGRLSSATLDWTRTILDRARRSGKAVLAMIHHGVLEHFQTEGKYFPPYLLSDRGRLIKVLSDYGVRIVFTGHFHAQDIVLGRIEDGHSLYDIETGSPITYPAAYRTIEVAGDQEMRIQTKYISATKSRPAGFTQYARDFTLQGLENVVLAKLRAYGFRTCNDSLLVRQAAEVLLNHYFGDEPASKRPIDISRVGCLGGALASVLHDGFEGLAHDLEPPDNDLVIDLKDGTWTRP